MAASGDGARKFVAVAGGYNVFVRLAAALAVAMLCGAPGPAGGIEHVHLLGGSCTPDAALPASPPDVASVSHHGRARSEHGMRVLPVITVPSICGSDGTAVVIGVASHASLLDRQASRSRAPPGTALV